MYVTGRRRRADSKSQISPIIKAIYTKLRMREERKFHLICYCLTVKYSLWHFNSGRKDSYCRLRSTKTFALVMVRFFFIIIQDNPAKLDHFKLK